MAIQRETADGHKFELFSEQGIVEGQPTHRKWRKPPRRVWGWDCITCDRVRTGLTSMSAAEQDCRNIHMEPTQ